MGWLLDLLFPPQEGPCGNCGRPTVYEFCSRQCEREDSWAAWLW